MITMICTDETLRRILVSFGNPVMCKAALTAHTLLKCSEYTPQLLRDRSYPCWGMGIICHIRRFIHASNEPVSNTAEVMDYDGVCSCGPRWRSRRTE